MNLQQKIKQLQDGALRAEKLIRLQEQFPDLEFQIDRWKTERLISKSIAHLVDKCDFYHTCGCCNDAPLKACPYLEAEGEKVCFPAICIAEKGWLGGDEPYENWRDLIINAGLNNQILKLAENYLNSNRPPKVVENDEPV